MSISNWKYHCVLAVSIALTSPMVWAADAPLTTQIVDALNKIYGSHPGFRANHAKGVVAQGTFKATPEAAKLSRAVLFKGSVIPVTVRFSDSGGLPTVADGSPGANPHGMAIKYQLPDGSSTDMVINSLKFFRWPPAKSSAICSLRSAKARQRAQSRRSWISSKPATLR